MTQGELLRELRIKAGLNQEQLADQAGLRQSRISQIETNRSGMMPKTAKAVAKPLKVEWTIFFADELRNCNKAS